MKHLNVSDLNSNYEENIQRWARELSKSDRRLTVFEVLYRGRKQSKSVDEIAVEAGLEKQAVRDAGKQLRAMGLCGHERQNVRGVPSYRYVRLPHISALRDRIARLARNPARIEGMPTKRQPLTAGKGVVNFSTAKLGTTSRGKRGSKSNAEAPLRIALLATNPHGDLRTDIEMRDIDDALRRTNLRESVDVRHVPAARVGDLLAQLNEYRPHVVHFSGHGGGGSIVLEENSSRPGGFTVNYDAVADLIDATDTPPKLLILNACDTFDGVEVFLDTVDAVVAMSDLISDAAATHFATQFYSAIGNGQSLGSAVKQGKALLRAGGFPDADLARVVAKDTIDLSQYRLVQ